MTVNDTSNNKNSTETRSIELEPCTITKANWSTTQTVEGETIDPFLYELYYKYKVNDSITMTPTLFGGTSKNTENKEAVMTGVLLQTTFKF